MDHQYISKIFGATEIVRVVGHSVALAPRGDLFVGACPFHPAGSASPTLQVWPARQFFSCSVCAEHGNAIDFVMSRDRVSFVSALRSLAEQAGIG